MTQSQRLLARLREGPATLSQILAVPGCAAEYRRVFSQLRDDGFDVQYHRARRCTAAACQGTFGWQCPAFVAGQNVYKLEAEPVQAAPAQSLCASTT